MNIAERLDWRKAVVAARLAPNTGNVILNSATVIAVDQTAQEPLAALKQLDECYCEGGDHLTRDQRARHRQVLIYARTAIAAAEGKN